MRNAALLAVAVAVGGLSVSEPAEAHRRSRVSIGVGFGYGYGFGHPFWGPPWWAYPAPYYYYPAPVIVQQPVTYIEQNPAATSTPAAETGWWYYCEDSRGYYPYVKQCPAGWQRVPPTPQQ